MACGGCGNGGRPQKVRRQVVESVKEQPAVIQHKVSRQTAAQPATIQRQYVVPRQQCAKCGYPTITVHIAGRERHQCSNANCRVVVQ